MTEWVNGLGIWWYVLFFLVVQLINVVFNTLKTIITSRASKIPAAIINALTFGFYSIVVILTAESRNVWLTVGLTVLANLIGVYFSIAVLDKLRKDKLWEITATVANIELAHAVQSELIENDISYNRSTACGKQRTEYIFHIYAPTQKQSQIIKKILVKNNAKYIVHEENKKL